MPRTLRSLTGIAMVSGPHCVGTIAEALAFENPEAADRHRWAILLARIEEAGGRIGCRWTGCFSGVAGALVGIIGFAPAVISRRSLDNLLSLADDSVMKS